MNTPLYADKKFQQKFTHKDANAVKAAITELDSNISNINSLAAGSPKGTYANLAALIAANPDHTYIYITLDNGCWNYWNGSAFVSGGVYLNTFQVDIGYIAVSPDWAVDANYNVVVPASQVDIYYNNQFKRISTGFAFTTHVGSDTICLDITDNLIKRVSTVIPGKHVILGYYSSFNFVINGNVKVITPNDTIYCNVKHSDILNETILGIKEYQNLAIVSILRGSISVNNNIVTIGVGNYYFNSKKGVEFSRNVTVEEQYTMSNDEILTFNLSTRIFASKSRTAITADECILLFYDAGEGFSKNGLWANVILNNKITSLTTRVSELETNTSKLPNFIITESNATFKRLLNWINGDNTFLIAQITDVHASSSTRYLHIGYLAELQKVFGFNILWNGGDIGLDTGETLDDAYTLMYNTKSQMQSLCPYILTKGNHDYGTQAIPTKTINDIFNVPQKRQFPNMVLSPNGYGYIDNSDLKIRTYFLNTTESSTDYNMSQTQLQWIADTMATLQSDWGVVVLSHLCVDPIGRWASYPNDTNGAYFDTFRSIMAALVAKSSGTNTTSGVSWNFTTVPTSVKLICNFAGDSHFNNSAITNGVNYIVRQGYGGIADSEMPSGATKDPFNYTTQCLFDILAVKKNGNAKVFRIGAGGETRDLAITY